MYVVPSHLPILEKVEVILEGMEVAIAAFLSLDGRAEPIAAIVGSFTVAGIVPNGKDGLSHLLEGDGPGPAAGQRGAGLLGLRRRGYQHVHLLLWGRCGDGLGNLLLGRRRRR